MFTSQEEHFIFDFDEESVDIRCTVLNNTLFWQLHKGHIVPKSISLPYSHDVSFTMRLKYMEAPEGPYYKLAVTFKNDSCDKRKICYKITVQNCKEANNQLIALTDIRSTDKIEANATKDLELIINNIKFRRALSSSSGFDIIIQVTEYRKKNSEFECSDSEQKRTERTLNLPVSLYQDDSMKDIKLVIGNSSVLAHKLVLATRSKVFRSMFTHNTRENQRNTIEMNDVSSKAVKAFIKYLYVEEVDVLEEVDTLLMLADKYDVQCLKRRCENYLEQTVNEKNAIDLFLKAEFLNLQRLKKRSLFVIKKNSKTIIDTEDFKRLYQYPHLIREILLLYCRNSFYC